MDEVTAQVATALLLIDVYGIESQDTGKDGENRMDIVNATLRKLQGTDED